MTITSSTSSTTFNNNTNIHIAIPRNPVRESSSAQTFPMTSARCEEPKVTEDRAATVTGARELDATADRPHECLISRSWEARCVLGFLLVCPLMVLRVMGSCGWARVLVASEGAFVCASEPRLEFATDRGRQGEGLCDISDHGGSAGAGGGGDGGLQFSSRPRACCMRA
ncbi:hypothetical protein BDW22DRAFT_1014613 [Trametopsis cervina]|nr:hypothetical protein BDW22DRAFT_1014613 [Trametopsis cervina]